MMGMLGGWFGVAAVAVLALFLVNETLKAMRGEVLLSARQKVVRVLGGVFLMLVSVMIVASPVALRRHSHDLGFLLYWLACFFFLALMLLMAVLDAGEVSRAYLDSRKSLRSRTLRRNDIERILRENRKDHPDDVG